MALIGICRGTRLINAVLGGNWYKEIRHIRVHTNNRTGILAAKLVHLEKGSKLEKMLNRPKLRVASLHHRAVDERC